MGVYSSKNPRKKKEKKKGAQGARNEAEVGDFVSNLKNRLSRHTGPILAHFVSPVAITMLLSI